MCACVCRVCVGPSVYVYVNHPCYLSYDHKWITNTFLIFRGLVRSECDGSLSDAHMVITNSRQKVHNAAIQPPPPMAPHLTEF